MNKRYLILIGLFLPCIVFAETTSTDGSRLPTQGEMAAYKGTDDKLHFATSGVATLVSGTFTRPADTTAYASGDLVANSTTAGSVTPITLTVGREATANGATGMIRRVRLSKTATSVTNAQFRIHFYSTSPTAANGDNGAWSTSQAANYLGAMDVIIDKAFTDGAQGIGISNVGSEINFTAQTVYVLIEARAAYTPSSAEVFTVKLEVIQN